MVEYAKAKSGKYIHVLVDQDLCTGDGCCAEDVPSAFAMRPDGYAYVRPGLDAEVVGHPYKTASNDDGTVNRGHVPIAASDLELAIEVARDRCPGECIRFVERDTLEIGIDPFAPADSTNDVWL